MEDIRANKDCIKIFQARLREAGVVTAEEFEAIDRQVARLIEDAVTQAEAAAVPAAKELLTDVYVAY